MRSRQPPPALDTCSRGVRAKRSLCLIPFIVRVRRSRPHSSPPTHPLPSSLSHAPRPHPAAWWTSMLQASHRPPRALQRSSSGLELFVFSDAAALRSSDGEQQQPGALLQSFFFGAAALRTGGGAVADRRRPAFLARVRPVSRGILTSIRICLIIWKTKNRRIRTGYVSAGIRAYRRIRAYPTPDTSVSCRIRVT